MRRVIAYWALFVATFGVYGLMVAWSLPALRVPDGSLPFDLRPRGYDYSQAQAYLTALTDAQVEYYLWTQQLLDLAFPALVTALVIWTSLWATKGRHWTLRWVAGVFAVAAMVFDYLENIAVRMMLQSDPAALDPKIAGWATMMTELKSAFGTLAYSVLLVLLIRVAWNRFFAGRRKNEA
ncbi:MULTISPECIES: hypothetical protein [Halocynthiibacter]|uniref:Uncharacterized protein n=1 Tax=Halocynthiibacter halioticoli TaxID=2986804 RepID=A0AAE3J293_9RHOB|nr:MULTISPECIES: hypothetical protein [Halocynthiibacter]MCV6825323.1 hypothetical protein [Halocynthiibacter halioticoli]MCW4058324.1 hypothetical protein [Halocynthiibacter sp. SDUM655004]